MKDLEYLFEEISPFGEGEEFFPGLTVKRVVRCINCLRNEKFLDSIYCAQKSYWAEENPNVVMPHCGLFQIPIEEENYLDCDEDNCKECEKKCVKKKSTE